MKRIILFRYHKEFEVCKQNINLLRQLNPGCAIFGLFGGDVDNTPPRSLIELLDGNYILPFEDPKFKWKNGDLCALDWFEKVGHELDFDTVNIIEWDLALTKPLDEIYAAVGDGLGVAGIMNYDYVKRIDWPWIFRSDSRPLWKKQLASVKNAPSIDETKIKFSVFGGIQIPRSFLEKYQQEQPQPFVNDEVRISLYAYLWNYKLTDVGLRTNPVNLLTARSHEYGSITDDKVVAALKNGAFAIHPARAVHTFEAIFEMLDEDSGSTN
ncbi:hypothetical protein FWG95_04475 [Candidatus Saccharibacteria bacterium]|nr:hypothetical protein [Candidatus Saccharibacteria bacterium]